jgi:outer membrane protein OmpA-like peptidoglycan-associated protein
MADKILVYGKSQGRTALGIVDAYLVMHPHALLDDLNKAFPVTLNDSCVHSKVNTLFSTGSNIRVGLDTFDNPGEELTLGDNTKIHLVQMWDAASFKCIVEQAKLYEIVVADYKPVQPFEKGGYRLEYLNGYIPPVREEKKSKWWLWTLLAAAVIALVLVFLLGKSCSKDVVKTQVVTVRDTVYVKQVQDLEKEFNTAQFNVNSADLTDQAKAVLTKLSDVLKKNKNVKLTIEGHSSKEGDEAFNQKLSSDRAKAAVDFLIGSGIESSRLKYEGKGSSEPVSETDLSANRRTEFIIATN